jgi:hypothetical protein
MYNLNFCTHFLSLTNIIHAFHESKLNFIRFEQYTVLDFCKLSLPLLLPVCCFAYTSTLKMETISFSESSDCLLTLRRYKQLNILVNVAMFPELKLMRLDICKQTCIYVHKMMQDFVLTVLHIPVEI